MRKAKPKKRIVLPDPKYNDVLVTRFVNDLMVDGKKNLSFQIFYDAFTILLFIIILTGVVVFLFVLKHVVEDTGDFVSGSGDCFWSSMFGSNSAIESTQSTLTTTGTLGRHPKSLCGSVR